MRGSIDRYVESLARRRRPKSFAPASDDLAVARVAIELSAEAGQDDGPREAFVADLRRRLAAREEELDREARGVSGRWTPGRRTVLATLAAAATGVAGLVTGHTLARRGDVPQVEAGGELRPNAGRWQSVAATTEVDDGAVVGFDLGAVAGFVRRESGQIKAVSAACSHQGCRLALNEPRRQLVCPCHGAVFSAAGQPLSPPNRVRVLPPLSELPVREKAGQIEVLAPM